MKSRSEILPIYSNFVKMVETQFSKRIKTFRSDNALKYTQYAFQALLHSYGTVHHLTQFPYVCVFVSQMLMYIMLCYGLLAQLLYLYSTLVLVIHFTCTAHLCLLYKALMYILSFKKYNTIFQYF